MKRHVFFFGMMVVLCMYSRAEATVWYVHPDSTLNSIQAAIDLCGTGDTVLVGPGTYLENINFNNKAITLTSEYGPDTTIIDGSNPAHPDTGSVVLFINGEDTTSILSGFTITGGSGTTYPSENVGGGILCLNNCSPVIIGNIITGNTAAYGGGGIACYASASPIIINNNITENSSNIGGGVIVGYYSSPAIEDNIVASNTASHQGGGIACGYMCSLSITANTIIDNTATNQGGGIIAGEGCSVAITSNTVTGNTAGACGGGIVIIINSTATIMDNVIAENSGWNGGGIDISYDCSATIANNTITQNQAIENGGGIFVGWSSDAAISGNDIIGNLAPFGGGIACYDNSSPTIIRNTITGNTGSTYGGGVLCNVNSNPSIDSCTISANSGDGVCSANGSMPEIHYNNIVSNTGYAVQNLFPAVMANAQNNWWGDASGPYHPTTNPGGLGDSVSDYVDFDPWLTGPGVGEQPIVKPVELCKTLTPTISRGPLRLPEGKKCRVFDITGRVVDPQSIQPGIYFIEIDDVITQKVVKVR